MLRKKYRFCPDTLTYIEIKPTRRRILKGILFYFLISLVLSFGYFSIFLKVSSTPGEKKLQKEKAELLRAYNDLDKKVSEMDTDFDFIASRDENIYRAIYDIKPIEINEFGTGGTDKSLSLDNLENSQLILNTAKKIDKLSGKMKVQKKSLEELETIVYRKQAELKRLPAIQPVENKDLLYTGSGFGTRFHPILNIYRMHEGLDFICPRGAEVYATADGKVSSVRVSTTFGKVVEIEHGNGYLTLYGHLSSFNVKQGKEVKRGEIIGFVGSTGLSSGYHLHYEVHKNGKAVNPISYFFNDLSPDQFVRMQMIADSIQQSMD
jgi:murein DD-endopeptidase MepM/ murein hydrolase activator NlpD